MNQVHMNKESLEALSAGVDGELSPHELRFLLRRLDHDVALEQTWSRYHLVRDSLRGRLPPLASADFAARTGAAIEREALPAAATRGRGWLRWSAGGAIAASVAAVTLMLGQPPNDIERMMAAQDAAPNLSVPTTSASAAHALATPSVVPPWLSGNAVGGLSQQASATFGGAPFAARPAMQAPTPTTYMPPYRYRALDNHDGSYLLLLDPEQTAPVDAVPRRAAAATR